MSSSCLFTEKGVSYSTESVIFLFGLFWFCSGLLVWFGCAFSFRSTGHMLLNEENAMQPGICYSKVILRFSREYAIQQGICHIAGNLLF